MRAKLLNVGGLQRVLLLCRRQRERSATWIGQTSCRNMLRSPRLDRMPVKVDVPTRNKASRVAEDNSVMRTSHFSGDGLSDHKAAEQE